MNDFFSETSDEMLLAHYKRGDKEAFKVLAERYHQRLFHFNYGYLACKKTALETTHKTMLHLVRSAARFKHESRFSTWLFTIARTLCNERARSGDIERSNEKSERTIPSELEVSSSMGNESGGHFLKALKTLHFPELDVFVLKQLGDMTYEEIAIVTGSTKAKVSLTLHSALEQLQAARRGDSQNSKGTFL